MNWETIAFEIGTIIAGIAAIIAVLKPAIQSINRSVHRAELLVRIERYAHSPNIGAMNEIDNILNWYTAKGWNHLNEITQLWNKTKDII